MNTSHISVNKRVRLLALACSAAALLLLALLGLTRVGVAQEPLPPSDGSFSPIVSLPSRPASLPAIGYRPADPAPSFAPAAFLDARGPTFVPKTAGPLAAQGAGPADPWSALPPSIDPAASFRDAGPASAAYLPDLLAPDGGRLPGGFPVDGSMVGAAGVAATRAFTLDVTYGTVTGYTDPNRDVHLLLWDGGTLSGEARARSDGIGYFYAELMHEGRWASVQPGNTLDVVVAGSTRNVAVPSLTGVVDPGSDQVSGRITGVPLPASLLVNYWGNRAAVTTDSSGDYTASLGGQVDVSWYIPAGVSYQDAGGNWVRATFNPLHGMVMQLPTFGVKGYTEPASTIRLTVNHGGQIAIYSGKADARTGWWNIEVDTLAAGDVVTAEFESESASAAAAPPNVATVSLLTAEADLPHDRVTGSGPAHSQVAVCYPEYHGATWWTECQAAPVDAAGQYAAALSAGKLHAFSYPEVHHASTARADTLFLALPKLIWVQRQSNSVFGYAQPGAGVTLTLRDNATPPAVIEAKTATASLRGGDFRASFSSPFQTGHHLTAEGGGLNTTVDLVDVSMEISAETDTVSGWAPLALPIVVWLWDADGRANFRDFASSGTGGDYRVDVGARLDLTNGSRGGAFFPQDKDIDQPGWHYAYSRAPRLELNEAFNGISGYVGKANVPITFTLTSSTGDIKGISRATSSADGWFPWRPFYKADGDLIDIVPGDQVVVDIPGWSQTLVTPRISLYVEPEAERVTGFAPANQFVQVQVQEGSYPTLRVPTDDAGRYLADFTGLTDIKRWSDVSVILFDGNWNRLGVTGIAPFARANTAQDTVGGWYGPGVSVQFTVTGSSGEFKGSGQGVAGWDAWLKETSCGCDIVPGDHVYVTTDTPFSAHLVPIAIKGVINVEADRVAGKMEGASFPADGAVYVWSSSRGQGLWLEMGIAADGTFTADFSGQFDIRLGDEATVWYYDANDNWVGTTLYTPHLDIELWFNPGGHSNMWSRAEPGAIVTVTTPYTSVTTQADAQGNWSLPDVGSLVAGDPITATATGLPPIAMPVPNPFDAQADSQTDKVWGQVGGWVNQRLEIHGNWSDGYREVTADAQGRFEATYPDLPRGGEGNIRFVNRLADYAQAFYHRPFQTSDLTMWVNYAHEHVYGFYEPGHTVWITVTSGDTHLIKATANVSTMAQLPWGGTPGFSVDGDIWSPPGLDIVPGDRVFGRLDNGQTTEVRVGTITGQVDVDDDSVSGRIYAPWFTRTLSVACHPWSGAPPNAPAKQSAAGPDGEPPYRCRWDPLTEWDLVPGQNVGVWYMGSDANWVGNGFRGPGPNLHVETWSEGGGAAQAGGPAVFAIRYWNDGDIAGRAHLTDSLPAGATYIADSSGFPATVSGNTVAWDLGAVQPMTRPVQFQLVLRNTANVSDTLHNVADIAAQYDTNWGDNHAEADVHVAAGQPDLYVSADASPGDPAPGQRYRWQIHTGNIGPVPSGRACITDTLPTGTTLIDWESQNGYRLWKLVSQIGRQLVFCIDAVPGNWGTPLLLNVRLDTGVPYDTQLLNRVEISTADDSDLASNIHVNDWTYSRPPRPDTGLHKWWGHGSLAASSEANYWIEYRNDGNVLLHNLVLTDTLPAGTTFITSVLDYGWGIQVPFEPSHIVGRQLVWNLGNLEVNDRQQFMLRLRINHDTPPGTLIANCAAIAGSDFEDNPYNDAECVDEAARAVGPNLRVTKFAWWEGPNRIYYGARIGNTGTTTEHNVVLTDTFPAALNISNWQVDFWEPWWWGQVGNQFTVTLSRVTPGATIWLHLRLDVPAVPHGAFFTNTAEITVPPGDVNPADNRDQIVVATGPDLSMRKWQSGGPSRPQPGDLVTYTLHLENHAQAWGTAGNVWITDTLPAGLEFVSARDRLCQPYFCPRDPDRVVGRSLAWNYGSLGTNNWRDLEITARVANTVRPGETLINTATICSDASTDVEPDYRDNTSTFTVVAAGKTLYLPVIMKR